MATKEATYKNSAEQLAREAEAERELAAFVAESKDRLGNRCPECGNLGSLEMFEGELKCVDCDVAVAVKAKLEGFGRR
jgi:hypothetical protein